MCVMWIIIFTVTGSLSLYGSDGVKVHVDFVGLDGLTRLEPPMQGRIADIGHVDHVRSCVHSRGIECWAIRDAGNHNEGGHVASEIVRLDRFSDLFLAKANSPLLVIFRLRKYRSSDFSFFSLLTKFVSNRARVNSIEGSEHETWGRKPNIISWRWASVDEMKPSVETWSAVIPRQWAGYSNLSMNPGPLRKLQLAGSSYRRIVGGVGRFLVGEVHQYGEDRVYAE